ncbi:hypothetical protein CF392_00275 [Tamilnaduibacter salinus]|uniref:Uncharacterized protein n=2 Tax=Tamilnaduibacter salinus TaxID=1484056 RepID=A0A2A2I8T2_9GAMM|nr:hypothetical protein CF392_00275 [Tamilnaduibacter salinus]
MKGITMKRLIAALAFLPCIALAGPTAKDICDRTKENAKELNPQMPIRADMGTTWIGISAVYMQGRCHVNHKYLVETEALIEVIMDGLEQRGQPRPRQDVVQWLQSSEGQALFKGKMRESLIEHIASIKGVEGVVLKARYSATDPLDGWTITVKSEQIE